MEGIEFIKWVIEGTQFGTVFVQGFGGVSEKAILVPPRRNIHVNPYHLPVMYKQPISNRHVVILHHKF